MQVTNLTRTDAQQRARLLAVESYDIELDLTSRTETFRSTTTIRFTSTEPGAQTFVDLVADTVHEVTLNGRSLEVAEIYEPSTNRIHLSDLAAENVLKVVADCAYSRTGEGLHRFVDPVDDEVYLYSQCETSDAQRIYACFDQPDLKATFAFSVIAPSHWQVVSNEAPGEPTAVRERVSRWEFPETPRISTYITALIAGPYSVVRDSYDGKAGTIPLGLYCRASLAQYLDPEELLEVTKQGFEFFEREFGRPYPFTKYDQLFVPEFNAGAMENAGAVTFLEDYVFRSKVTDAARDARANTILHEMAHMWFGDLVTMRWWDDLWLNESFAEFMAYHSAASATRFRGAWTGFATGRKAWGYRQDQLPSTHPIRSDAPDVETAKTNFDGITYAKGASVLRQLVAWVGLEEFMAGVRAYFDRHAWGNTQLHDLLVELEATSGRDLSAWSEEWLETAGCNTLRPVFEVAADGTYSSFSIAQEAPEDHPTLRSHRIAIGLYDRADGRILRRDRIEIDVVGASTDVPELVGVRQPDLLLINDDDLTFAKIRLDERSMHTLIDAIGEIDSSLARALCWSSAWDMTRDSQMRTRDFVEIVCSGIGRETDLVAVQTILRQARLALDQFADPTYRPTGLQRLADTMRGLLPQTAPGRDHQLAFVRAFASSAISQDDLGFLRGLLDGSQSLPDLAVDTDLRWHLLGRLVVTGQAGPDDIDAELRRDPTASGQRQAAALRAAVPTAEAKAAAWGAVVERDELPNALQGATIAGFANAEQLDLVRPYRDRYFAEIGQVWHERTTEMASNIAIGLFPALLVEQETVDASDAWLAQTDQPPALHRLVLEGRDGVERALRARGFDAR